MEVAVRKRPLRRLRKRCKDNIKMDLGEICCEDGRWNWFRIVCSGVLKLRVLFPERQ
jgi:hypothetical protein